MKLKDFIKSKNLSEIILKKNKNNQNILAIRQLQIMRPHPVFLKDYDSTYDRDNIKLDTKNFFEKIIDLFINFFKEKKFYYTNSNLNNNNKLKKKVLFLNHLINISHINHNEDFYYGNLINNLRKNNFNTINILRNFTGYSSKFIYQQNRKFFKNKIILSKSLNLYYEIKLIIKVLITFINLKKKQFKNKEEREFFKKKKILKFSGSIYNSLKLLIQFDIILNKFKPKFIFLTFEGHSWERVIINHVKKKYPNIIILSYQFSILTKYSSSIYLNLGRNFTPDIVLTSGNYSKKKLIKKLGGSLKFINIGSNKFILPKFREKKNLNVLVVPEGFNSETIKMFKFAMKASKIIKKKNFIFRFHPMMDKNFFFKNLSIDVKKIPKNLIFSKSTFKKDVEKSSYIIYRGSAASIQALSSGVIPIYLKLENEINIDPLYMLKKKFYVSNVNDLNKILDNKNTNKMNKKNIFFTKEYFDKPNYKVLIEYLNKLNDEKV